MPEILLITGGQIAAHDYDQSSTILAGILQRNGLSVQATHSADAVHDLSGYAALVLFTDGDFFDERGLASIISFVRNGGGLVSLHTTAGTNKSSEAFGKLIGSRILGGAVLEHNAIVADPEHPIMHRISDFRIDDEIHDLEPLSDFRTLITAWWNGKKQPLAYVKHDGAGRVVHLATGHSIKGVSHPTWQQIFARSVRYAAGEDWSGKVIKCAAIGYGGAFNMGRTHLESCKKARLTPVAVCDVDPLRTATAKAELGEHIQTFNSVERMLAESDADLVTVITPHNLHAPLSLQVLKSGRHVVTEKPYTITIDEATTVIEAARAAGKMATVFHNRRWDGDFVAIRDVVQSGILGEVFHIECAFGGYGEPRADWWRSYKEPSGGAFFDWGAHFVDWILQLMPYAIESVSGDFKKLKWQQVSNEDYTSAYIRFAGGRSASVEQGNVNAIDKARWRILGTEGGLQKAGWDWEGKEGLKLVTFRNGQRVESTLPYGKSDWDGFYRNVADHLILGEPLAVTPESARDVIAILSLAEQSSKQGGMPLPLPYARS